MAQHWIRLEEKPLRIKSAFKEGFFSVEEIANHQRITTSSARRCLDRTLRIYNAANTLELALLIYKEELVKEEKEGALLPRTWRKLNKILSPQELAIARLVGQGKNQKHIAEEFRVCPATIRRKMEIILEKTGLWNIIELGLLALREDYYDTLAKKK